MPLQRGAVIAAVVVGALAMLRSAGANAPTPFPAASPTPIVGATEAWSQKRLFRVSYVTAPAPVPMLALHDWTITIADGAGRPVDGARITVLGGMPAHAHGLPTTPTVRGLGNGRYLVEGLEFHMPGAWIVAFRINAAAGIDAVSFALDLP
jgi:hypothetical protein